MKTKLFTLFSLLALLLVSTAALADGRPTGLRIGRAVGTFGDITPMVQIDVTVTDTFVQYCCNYTYYYYGYYAGFLTAVNLGSAP